MNIFDLQEVADRMFKERDQDKKFDYALSYREDMYDVILEIFFPGKTWANLYEDETLWDHPLIVRFADVRSIEYHIDAWSIRSELIDVYCGGVRDTTNYKKYILQALHDQGAKCFESDEQHNYIFKCNGDDDSIIVLAFKVFHILTGMACRPPYI